MMGTDLDALRKQVKVLEHENSNLKARERHGNATGGRGHGPEGGGADQKKVEDLMQTVETLQTEKAVSRDDASFF